MTNLDLHQDGTRRHLRRDQFGRRKIPSLALAQFKRIRDHSLATAIDPQMSWHRFNRRWRRQKQIRKAQRTMRKFNKQRAA